MPSSGSLLVKKSEDEQKDRISQLMSLLPLVTFEPMGNPLDMLQQQQRRMFFETLGRTLNSQQIAEQQRAKAIVSSAAASQKAPYASAAAVAAMKIAPLKKREARQGNLEQQEAERKEKKGETWQGHLEQQEAERKEKKGETHLPVIVYSNAPELKNAHERLASEVGDYARGDGEKAQAALSEFESRLHSQGYKIDDLMAAMLLVIEDKIWEGEEGKPGGAQAGGMGMKVQHLVPTKLREAAKDSGEARLASVREMLRYYFQTHPKDYALALAAALSLTADQEEDTEFLQERLASELARIGGFAFAQKLLAELKRKKKMDTKKCLKELGYRYNVKEKKLILGKRTCGKAAEAKGIVGLLLAGLKKDKDDD